jgi:hypothetical protein
MAIQYDLTVCCDAPAALTEQSAKRGGLSSSRRQSTVDDGSYHTHVDGQAQGDWVKRTQASALKEFKYSSRPRRRPPTHTATYGIARDSIRTPMQGQHHHAKARKVCVAWLAACAAMTKIFLDINEISESSRMLTEMTCGRAYWGCPVGRQG